VGSLLASLTGLGLAPLLARLAKVPGRTLVPFVVALGFLGVFAAADELAQVTVMVAFGVVGYLMTRFGYSLPAAMIGFILGKVVENNLYLVSQLQGWGALKRPLTDVMVAITVLSLFGPLFKRAFRLLVPRRDPLPPALRTAGAAGGQGDPDAAAAPGRTDGPAAPEGEPAGPSGTPAGESPVTTPSGGAGESGENR